jgi:hypothetical protein
MLSSYLNHMLICSRAPPLAPHAAALNHALAAYALANFISLSPPLPAFSCASRTRLGLRPSAVNRCVLLRRQLAVLAIEGIIQEFGVTVAFWVAYIAKARDEGRGHTRRSGASVRGTSYRARDACMRS